MYKYFLGLEYLLSRWINLLGIIGVAIAVWALVVVIGVFSGFVEDARLIIRGAASDLSLIASDMNRSYAEIEEILAGDPEVVAMAPRLAWFGILHTGHQRGSYLKTRGKNYLSSDFIRVVGIDFEAESRVTLIRDWLEEIDEGTLLRTRDPGRPFHVDPAILEKPGFNPDPAVLLGLDRASRLGQQLRMGQRVTLSSGRRAEDGEVKGIKKYFTLTGCFQSGHPDYDNNTALVHIEELRKVFGHDEEDPESLDIFNEVAIQIRDFAKAPEVVVRLNRELEEKGIPARVFTWEDRQESFLQAVEQERGMMKIVLLILMVVASFLIFATLSMMVTEKTKDIGILASLGATRGGILTIFVICGLAISAIGTFVGSLVGIVSCIYINPLNDAVYRLTERELFPRMIYGRTEIPYILEPTWILQVGAGAILLAFLFSIYPAYKAARLDPVRTLGCE